MSGECQGERGGNGGNMFQVGGGTTESALGHKAGRRWTAGRGWQRAGTVNPG